MPVPSSTPPGWFADPLGRYDHRYFNGTSWTSDVSTDGQRFVDPLGTGPGNQGASSPGSDNGAATAAVVMGSIGAAIAWVPVIVVFGFALAIMALVFGTIGLRRSRDSGVGKAASIAGIVLGCVGMAVAVVGVVLTVGVVREVITFVEPGNHHADVVACELDGRRAEVDGFVTNLDDEPRSYTVFVEVGSRREFVSVDDVEPGDTETWSITVTTPSPLAQCDPEVIVNGPFPYGIEVDPVAQ